MASYQKRPEPLTRDDVESLLGGGLDEKLGKSEKAVDSEKLAGRDADGYGKVNGSNGTEYLTLDGSKFAYVNIRSSGKVCWDVGKAPNRNFFVNRFDVDGNFIDSPFLINAATGKVKFGGFEERTVWSGDLRSVILGTSDWWPGDGFYRVGISTGEDLLIYAKQSGVTRGTQYAVGRSYYVAARCVNGTFKVEGANLSDGSYQALSLRYINKLG